MFRFATPLAEAHDEEHLSKFEELLEAAIDLDRVPDEYLIAANYDAVGRFFSSTHTNFVSDGGAAAHLDRVPETSWQNILNY